MYKSLKYIIIFFLLVSASDMMAQVTKNNKNVPQSDEKSISSEQDTSKSKGLIVDGANSQFVDATGETEKLYLRGDVRLTHDSIFMFCDTAVIVNNDMHAKGSISIIKNDTIRIFSDSLLYKGDSLMAYFVGNVVLEDGSRQLFTSFLQYDLERDWAIYSDTALLVSKEIKLKSKRGIFHLDEDYVNFYENVSVEGEDFDLFSDSLRFYSEQQKAVFLSPTLINQDGKRIYTERGYIDMDDGLSLFTGNAQFVDGDEVSTADTIKNDENKNITELIGNAKFNSPTDEGRAHTIIYNKETNEIELRGNAFFKNPENEVSGELIFYNKKTDNVRVQGRSYLSNEPMIIVADNLDYDKMEGIAQATGNVIWQDTSSNFEIECDNALYIDSIDYMKAYNLEGKPILKNEISAEDTLFLSGDTLISFTERIENDTFRYFTAYNHVEMINSDMQSICDSLMYNGKDSIFTLTGNPVMWTDTTQFNADTIIIYMKDDVIDKIDLINNAMIISTEDFAYYNQISGTNIKVLFKEGEIDKMNVSGNSQSVFYLKDDDEAYTGVNETTCSNMIFLFDEGELFQTRFYKDPVSKLTPMEMANHEALKLDGFQWVIEKRPMKVEDLYYW